MRKQLVRVAIAVAILGPAVIMGWWWLDHYAGRAATHTVQSGDVVIGVMVSGTTRSTQKTAVAAEVVGLVRSLPVAEGQTVQPGDLLAVLDDGVIEAELARARANVELATQRLAELRAGPRPEEIAGAEAELARARTDLIFATSQHEKVLAASQAGVASSTEVESVQMQLSRAQSGLNWATSQLDLLRAGTRAEQLAAAQAQLDLARADLQRCEALREMCQLRAHHAGIVTVHEVNEGEVVSPGQVLLRVENPAALEIRAQVQESQLDGVEIGAAARVLADAYPDAPLEAVVSRILPRVDPERGTITVLLMLTEEPTVALMDGMAVDIAIISQSRQEVLRVPVRAVRAEGDLGQVHVRNGLGFQTRQVSLGASDGAWVEIVSGLSAGDIIRLP